MARENLFEKGIALDPFKTADHSRGSMAWNTSQAILLYCNLIAASVKTYAWLGGEA